MTFAFRPPVIDHLTLWVERVRPDFAESIPICERAQNFWSAVVAARDLGASDVVEEEFLELARATGLTADLGRHGEEDIKHLIRWGLLNQNPFC